jgi:hypothetical protein
VAASRQVALSHILSHTACLRYPIVDWQRDCKGVTQSLGYARVSTAGQHLDGQLAVLVAQGVESGRVLTDKLSGAVNTERPGRSAQRLGCGEQRGLLQDVGVLLCDDVGRKDRWNLGASLGK